MKEIQLSKGKSTIVDDDDYEVLNQYKWYCSHGYAVRDKIINKSRTSYRMHRVIMNCPENMQVDHINGNPLDNRKINLRICTKNQNNKNLKKPLTNKTGYKGVSYCKSRKKYCSYISINNKTKPLGRFDTAVEAAKAYNKAASEYYGEFANLNKLESNET